MGPRSHERGKPDIFLTPFGACLASMGPRSHERGNEKPRRLPARTSRLQWGRVLMNAETRMDGLTPRARRNASMGPRSHERGNSAYVLCDCPWGEQLQWGRVLMNAETETPSRSDDLVLKLQWGRVLMNAETFGSHPFERGRDLASMGPRSHERGNLARPELPIRHHRSLQWGRVLMNAETRSAAGANPRQLLGFNGAAFS